MKINELEIEARQRTCVKWYKSMLDLIPENAHIILDLGCGEGHLVSYLHEKGRYLLGLDINISNYKYHNLKGLFLLGDAHKLPFKDDSLDTILAFEIFEHLERPEEAVNEIKRCLRKGASYF